MTREKFLTVRWNNLLSLGLGIPALIYVIVAFSTLAWSTRGGFVAFTVIIFVRLGANLYVNVVRRQPEQFESFPTRMP